MSSKRPRSANSLKPAAIREIASQELPPVLVRDDNYVQSTGRIFGRNSVERTQTGPGLGPDADRGD